MALPEPDASEAPPEGGGLSPLPASAFRAPSTGVRALAAACLRFEPRARAFGLSAAACLRFEPRARAFAAELRAALEAAVDRLPEALRLAFLTREVEGMSTAEAAASLGVSEGAIKVRLHGARERLRADLERRIGAATAEIYAFGGDRCDRVVALTLGRLGRPEIGGL